MKYLFILLMAVVLCGCSTKTEVKEDSKLYLEGGVGAYKVREFEYGGCEYIAFGEGNNLTVTHKGNCKYCQERRK